MKKEKIKLELEFYKEDECKVLRYELWLSKMINKGEKIPARVLKSFLALVNLTKKDHERTIEFTLNNAKDMTLRRFSNDKHYSFTSERLKLKFYFEINKSNKKPKKEKELCSFELMIENVFNSFSIDSFIEMKKEGTIVKKKLAQYIYGLLINYKHTLPDSLQKFLSHYKLSIITAFICGEMGYPYISQKNPSNQLVFDKIKNVLKK